MATFVFQMKGKGFGFRIDLMLSVVQFLFRFFSRALGLAVLFENTLENLDEERVLDFLGGRVWAAWLKSK